MLNVIRRGDNAVMLAFRRYLLFPKPNQIASRNLAHVKILQ